MSKEPNLAQTTKHCPVCNNKNLILLTSLNKKACVLHNKVVYIDWFLEKGQKPVFS